MPVVALHSCQIQLGSKRPIDPSYPIQLKTLGDHLRKARLDRGLSQPEVAKILNATPDTVTGWELNRYEPTAKMAKSIIAFLGYFPFVNNNSSLGHQLYYARLISGKTQREVAEMIGCDVSNLRLIELDQRHPQLKMSNKIQDYIRSVFESVET